jgi:ankyrin repeat protein
LRATDGTTALHQASFHGHAEVVRELLSRGAAVDALIDDGATPLIRACTGGHLAAATLLLDAGADPTLRFNNGASVLQCAEGRVKLDDEEPEEGEEPPTAAQRREHKALVRLLKKRGAA